LREPVQLDGAAILQGPTGEANSLEVAGRVLVEHMGALAPDQFGPVALRELRDHMVRREVRSAGSSPKQAHEQPTDSLEPELRQRPGAPRETDLQMG
jgi:hypothetical protein